MAAAPIAVFMKFATAAMTVYQAYSAYQGGRMQEANYRAQQQSANYNATIQEQNAALARQQANAREEAQRRASRQMQGEQRAALSQAGMGLGGSFGKILAQDAAAMELDALNIRYEGDLQARGLLAGAEMSRWEGQVAGVNARSARRAGTWDAATSLLSGATQAYGGWRKVKKGGYTK
jgi:hypothetical protein